MPLIRDGSRGEGLYVCARSPYGHGVDLVDCRYSGGAQTIYKSIGPDGTPIYSDKPPANGKIERTYEFVELPSSPLPVQATPLGVIHGSQAEHNHSSGVVLYSAEWCGYCKRAHAYLAQKGIAYQDIDIETPDGRAAFANAGGRRGIPLLIASGQRVQGFSQNGYDAFFAGR